MNWHFEAYSLEQWIMLFFIYGFLGYVWEVAYVSCKQHKLTDRGFLYGPIVPIYGAGAIIVLWATIPFKENAWLVFICGMLAATLLEYVTGWLMEKIFAVRYWDYSEDFLNVNGYICLKASLAWGVFSVALINLLHPLAEKILFIFPPELLSPLAFLGTVVFSVDLTCSVRTALDLKALLREMAQNNEELRRLKKRLDVIAAVAADDKENFKERINLELENIAEKVEELKDIKQERTAVRSMRKIVRRERLQKAFDERRVQLEEMLSNIKDKEIYLAKQNEMEDKEGVLQELSSIKERLKEIALKRNLARQKGSFKSVQTLLKRNNSAASQRYAEALEELRQLRRKNNS